MDTVTNGAYGCCGVSFPFPLRAHAHSTNTTSIRCIRSVRGGGLLNPTTTPTERTPA